MRVPRLLLALLVFLLPGLSAAAGSARLPVETLFRASDFGMVRVSPDGRYVSFLTTLGTGRVGIALMDVTTGKVEPLVAAEDEDYRFYLWKGAGEIVFGGDFGGNESMALRAIRLKDRRIVELAESFRERYTENANWAAMNNALPLDPDHIVILGNNGAGSWDLGLFLLDVRTGHRAKVSPAFDVGGVVAVGVDHHGAVRYRERRAAHRQILETRGSPQGEFVTLASSPDTAALEWEKFEPLQFAADNDTLYMLVRDDAGRERLRAYRTSQQKFAAEPDYVLPGNFARLVLSPDQSKLDGIYYSTERPGVHWFDGVKAALQQKLDAALPGTFNEIISSSDDDQVHIVVAQSDRRPPVYFLLNLRPQAKAVLSVIGCANAQLAKATLAPMTPVSYRARDGLTIHGYLTLPVGYTHGTRIPLIIHPHGGPYGIRDEWGYDPEVQFFASRGYAVLQPNYRGSGGYGRDFLFAGRHEWGGKMQDDLTDGVQWAVREGIADPHRVAIVGASYGGYAALAGVAFTPELYCCAVNYVGPSDLAILTSHARRGDPDRLYSHFWIGDDPDYVYSHSPVNFVARIKVPTLHAYGENDPRVDIDHWRRLKAELDRDHKPYEFVDNGDEGHGFHHESSRISFYRRVDAFLARYLGQTDPAGEHPASTR